MYVCMYVCTIALIHFKCWCVPIMAAGVGGTDSSTKALPEELEKVCLWTNRRIFPVNRFPEESATFSSGGVTAVRNLQHANCSATSDCSPPPQSKVTLQLVSCKFLTAVTPSSMRKLHHRHHNRLPSRKSPINY